MRKKLLMLPLMLLIVLVFSANVYASDAVNITKSSTSYSMYNGTNRTFIIKKISSEYEQMWSSSNANIAAVTSEGKVTAYKPGSVVIKCEVKNRTFKIKLKVKARKMSSLSLSADKKTLKRGRQLQ